MAKVGEERDVNIKVENVPGCSFLAPCPVCWHMTIGKECGRRANHMSHTLRLI
jgi:hypothetical protein